MSESGLLQRSAIAAEAVEPRPPVEGGRRVSRASVLTRTVSALQPLAYERFRFPLGREEAVWQMTTWVSTPEDTGGHCGVGLRTNPHALRLLQQMLCSSATGARAPNLSYEAIRLAPNLHRAPMSTPVIRDSARCVMRFQQVISGCAWWLILMASQPRLRPAMWTSLEVGVAFRVMDPVSGGGH